MTGDDSTAVPTTIEQVIKEAVSKVGLTSEICRPMSPSPDLIEAAIRPFDIGMASLVSSWLQLVLERGLLL